MKLQAGVDDLFDHFAQLIHFDRKNTAIQASVTKLADRVLEGQIDRFDPVTKQILKTNDERETQVPGARLVNHFENVDPAALFLQWGRDNVSVFVDRKITGAPTIYIVGSNSGLNIPLALHFTCLIRGCNPHCQSASETFKRS